MALASPKLAAQHAGPWELLRSSSELSIWQRSVPNSDIREVKVEAVIPAPTGRLWQVIRDTAAYPQFLPYVKEARILTVDEAGVRTIYQKISPPLVSQRDFVIRQIAQIDSETGVYQQDFEGVTGVGPAPVDGVVRITAMHGRWVLEPVTPTSTRLVYWLHADPGGHVPAWIINFGQRYSLPKLFKAIERRALQ
jgi:hypothetical protein